MVEPSFGACHARNEIMFAMLQHDATGNVTRRPTSAENCGGTVSRRWWWTEFRYKVWTMSIVIIRITRPAFVGITSYRRLSSGIMLHWYEKFWINFFKRTCILYLAFNEQWRFWNIFLPINFR